MNLDAIAVLKMLIAAPFLFFLPGFLVTITSSTIKNWPERIILSTLLSVSAVAVLLDVLERTVARLTPITVAAAVAALTVAAFGYHIIRIRVR